MSMQYLFKQPTSLSKPKPTSVGPASRGAGRFKQATSVAPQIVQDVIASNGSPLPDTVRKFFEPGFGFDLSQVRVHTNFEASKSADVVAADAYTVGRNIVFAEGQYSPHSEAGRRLLAHELTHVVQQRNATPSPQVEFGNQSGSEEREASRVAEQVQQSSWNFVPATSAPAAVQKSKRKGHRPRPDRRPKDTDSIHPEEQIGRETAYKNATCGELIETIQMILERLESRAEDLHAHGGGDSDHDDRYDNVLEDLEKLHEQAIVKCKNGEYSPDLIERVETELQFKKSPHIEPPAFTKRVQQTLLDVGVPVFVITIVTAGIIAALLTANPLPAIAGLIGATAAVLFLIAIDRRRDVPADELASALNGMPDTTKQNGPGSPNRGDEVGRG